VANGKVVVITGASHGIGASLVSAYSEAGYNVVANALSIEPSSNPSIINVPGDIGKPETDDRIMCVPSICRSAWQSSRSDSIVFAPNSIAAITQPIFLASGQICG
jgi:NAD(P)-dependent dehydrogenase (short-subunit alcohol dehydrogenase family)